MKIISDTLQPMNPRIQAAIQGEEPEPIRKIVQSVTAKDIHGIDINCGPLSKEPEQKMRFLVDTVQQETRLPLFLDTTNAKAIEAGLRVCRNPVTINGLSLEPAKLKSILPLALAYDVDIVCYLLTEEGQVPRSLDERLGIAARLFHECVQAGISAQRLVIDPIVVPLLWDDGLEMNRDLLVILKLLPEVLGHPVRTIAGLSNLTAGIRDMQRKMVLECAFLPMMAYAGLKEILMNVDRADTLSVAGACRRLLCETVFG